MLLARERHLHELLVDAGVDASRGAAAPGSRRAEDLEARSSSGGADLRR